MWLSTQARHFASGADIKKQENENAPSHIGIQYDEHIDQGRDAALCKAIRGDQPFIKYRSKRDRKRSGSKGLTMKSIAPISIHSCSFSF